MAGHFDFPDPVNDTSARLVAGGVVTMAVTAIAVDQPVLLVPLVYGFAARVASGPRYSRLALLATRVITPRLQVDHTFSPGPPKRLAQGMGLAISATALILRVAMGKRRASQMVLAALVIAATLEAALGLCLACKMYPWLVRAGIVPEEWCPECANVGSRHLHHHRDEDGSAGMPAEPATAASPA